MPPRSVKTVPFEPLQHPILFREPERLSDFSVWRGHIPFAMLLIDRVRPKTLVELGTHYGDSYCAFCQAIVETGAETKCFAVDTWAGDEHAGFYEDAIYNDLKAHHDPRYSTFSTLIRSLFDDAVTQFEDDSIDILHIDGLHTYEAVKHDFETYLPKVSKSGIVLFHDTAVTEGDFGVYKFWDEVKDKYPSFAFTHAGGLGVLGVGPEVPDGLRFLFDSQGEQRELLQKLFQSIGERLALKGDLPFHARNLENERASVETVREELSRVVAHRTEVQAEQRRLYDENATLHAAVAELHADKNAKQAEIERLLPLEQQLAQILNSRSWRMAQRMSRVASVFRGK